MQMYIVSVSTCIWICWKVHHNQWMYTECFRDESTARWIFYLIVLTTFAYSDSYWDCSLNWDDLRTKSECETRQGFSALPWVFVAVWHITGEAGVSHMTHNAAAPGDLDGVLADLLHRAVAAHVEEVWLEVLTVAARLPPNQEQGTSEIRGGVWFFHHWNIFLSGLTDD